MVDAVPFFVLAFFIEFVAVSFVTFIVGGYVGGKFAFAVRLLLPPQIVINFVVRLCCCEDVGAVLKRGLLVKHLPLQFQ